MRSLFLTLIFIAAIGCVSFTHAQSAKAAEAQGSPAWPEVKAMQKEERDALRNKQDSEFRLLLDIQKDTADRLLSSAANANDLSKLFAEERAAAMKTYAEERSRLEDIQAQERKAFYPKP
jgi:hypothetical protein